MPAATFLLDARGTEVLSLLEQLWKGIRVYRR